MQTLFILFLLAAGVQIIYLILFSVALSKKGTNAKEKGDCKPTCIIVCAHDEEQNLRELIPILLSQDHPEFEVIIVNDRSNDGTYDFLLEETKKHSQLKMVNIQSKPGHVNAKKYAITLAIKSAKHDWIVLTDADCRPQSTAWLRSMSEMNGSDKDIVLGYSPYIKEEGFLNLFIRFETIMTAVQYVSFALLGKPYMGVGRNLAYKKSLFLTNKGFGNFNQVTGGDDDLFVNQNSNKNNVSVVVGEEALVYSIPEKTVQSFFLQKVRHLAAGKKYKPEDQFLLGLFMSTLALTWIGGISMLIVGFQVEWVLTAIVGRLIILMFTIHQGTERFGHKFEWWTVPLLDFLFVIYYLSTAPIALFTKKLQWRN